jgi:YggT family protein
MFVVSNFIGALAFVLDQVLFVYMIIVIASAVLSWVNPDPYNPIVRFLRAVTEPVYVRIRQYVPTVFGGIDFTPIIVLLAIAFLQKFLVASLYDAARGGR